ESMRTRSRDAAPVAPAPRARNSAKASILLIGAGRMGSALLKGWLASGVKSIAVVEPKPSPALLKLVREKKVQLVGGPSQVKGKPSVCIVAIKPQILKGEAP